MDAMIVYDFSTVDYNKNKKQQRHSRYRICKDNKYKITRNNSMRMAVKATKMKRCLYQKLNKHHRQGVLDKVK